jgi:hypothetical protein
LKTYEVDGKCQMLNDLTHLGEKIVQLEKRGRELQWNEYVPELTVMHHQLASMMINGEGKKRSLKGLTDIHEMNIRIERIRIFLAIKEQEKRDGKVSQQDTTVYQEKYAGYQHLAPGQAIGNQQQATGSQPQASGSRQQTTGSQNKAIEYPKKATGNRKQDSTDASDGPTHNDEDDAAEKEATDHFDESGAHVDEENY